MDTALPAASDKAAMAPDESGRGEDRAQHPAASRLVELLGKRLRRFAALLMKVLATEDAAAVHDLRVYSRRSQQVLAVLFSKPRSRRVTAVMRALRATRRATGQWRSLDVALERLSRRMRRVKNPEERRAWLLVKEALARKREIRIKRARRAISKLRVVARIRDADRLAREMARQGAQGVEPMTPLGPSIASAWQQWTEALDNAQRAPDPATVHALRIATKRLRYRLEVAADLGQPGASAVVSWLKSAQNALGNFHDRHELRMMAADALARPQLLLSEPKAASALLLKLARDHQAAARNAARLVGSIAEAQGRARVESWVAGYCPPASAAPQPVASEAE